MDVLCISFWLLGSSYKNCIVEGILDNYLNKRFFMSLLQAYLKTCQTFKLEPKALNYFQEKLHSVNCSTFKRTLAILKIQTCEADDVF